MRRYALYRVPILVTKVETHTGLWCVIEQNFDNNHMNISPKLYNFRAQPKYMRIISILLWFLHTKVHFCSPVTSIKTVYLAHLVILLVFEDYPSMFYPIRGTFSAFAQQTQTQQSRGSERRQFKAEIEDILYWSIKHLKCYWSVFKAHWITML